MKKLILLLFVSFSTIGLAQQTRFQKIDSLLTFLNANHKFMGSFSILEKDKITFAKAYGFADIETDKKLNAETKLKIGSITKTFTATMIMQLTDENKLTLDTKLSKFYPEIPNADKITIHDLLHHRTGIVDYLNGDSTIIANIYRFNTKEEMIAKIAEYQPLFKPGFKYEYSNSNYYLLGSILEDITKKSYAANLNSRILKKLQLKNTSFPQKTDPKKNEGHSYLFDGTTWKKTPEWDNSIAFAAGAIVSTPSDLNLFMKGLFDGKLVSKESLDQMKSMEDNYGKGLIIAPFYERKFYGHTGGIENFSAATGYNPEEKIGFTLIVNGDNYKRNDIMIGVLNLFYDRAYSFPDLSGFKVSEETLAKYAGTYTSKSLPLKITITKENGKLTAQATGQNAFPLTPKNETEFIFDAAAIRLIFGENKFTLKQAGMEFEFTKEQ